MLVASFMLLPTKGLSTYLAGPLSNVDVNQQINLTQIMPISLYMPLWKSSFRSVFLAPLIYFQDISQAVPVLIFLSKWETPPQLACACVRACMWLPNVKEGRNCNILPPSYQDLILCVQETRDLLLLDCAEVKAEDWRRRKLAGSCCTQAAAPLGLHPTTTIHNAMQYRAKWPNMPLPDCLLSFWYAAPAPCQSEDQTFPSKASISSLYVAPLT